MKKVHLYGAGGHARVIIDILKSKNINIPTIFDNNFEIKELMGIPVLHDIPNYPLIICIGNNISRKTIVKKLNNISYAKALDISAIISESAFIEEGTVVMQGAIIQSSVEIGKHAIINTRATIDHNCIIGDYSHIAPGTILCGDISVGEGTMIGAGSVVIPGIKIGKWSVIGAGSVVTKDIPDNVIAYGSPCRVIKNIINEQQTNMALARPYGG